MRLRTSMALAAQETFAGWEKFQAIKWRWQLVGALQHWGLAQELKQVRVR